MNKSWNFINLVVTKGKATKVLSFAKKNGIKGGTIVPALGTVSDKLLNFLSIFEQEKELVLMGCCSDQAKEIIPKLVDKFNLKERNKGILFTTKLEMVVGIDGEVECGEVLGDDMYKLITVIIDKGVAEDIVDTANKAGARGGTILNARGAGTKETLKLFNMEIEPEKEILLIIAKSEVYRNIVEQINIEHNIQAPGKGIVFVQDIHEAHGLFE